MTPAGDRILTASGLEGLRLREADVQDSAVFEYLAPIISQQFFPSEDKLAGLIRTFGVFAIGGLIRPVGGSIFGQIEDRHGRRKALILSVAMMAIPATLVGRLPTNAQVGILAPVPLLVLRMLQGLSIVPPLQ